MVDIAVWQQINEQVYKSFHPIKPLILDSFDLTAACDDVLSVYFDGVLEYVLSTMKLLLLHPMKWHTTIILD